MTTETRTHTPGPWKAVNDTLVRGPHGEAVASTKGFAQPFDVNHGANAALIAAAPDLLDALRELVDAASALLDKRRGSGTWTESTINIARAAIEKATSC